jgi:hypothetical protein
MLLGRAQHRRFIYDLVTATPSHAVFRRFEDLTVRRPSGTNNLKNKHRKRINMKQNVFWKQKPSHIVTVA